MTLAAGVIAPHPPILIPQVGGEYRQAVAATSRALQQVSAWLDAVGAEALVFISPHSPIFRERFIVRAEDRLYGDFEEFGALEPRFSIENDLAAVEAIVDGCRGSGVPLEAWESPTGPWLDWGVTVPYSYLGMGRPIVSLSIALLPSNDHWALGEAISASLSAARTRYAFLASGDLSHSLTAESPNGYSPRGAEFDRLVAETVGSGRLGDLLELDYNLVESAAECGLRSIIALGGAFSEADISATVLSYEGPFGVGYLVATLAAGDGTADV